MLDKSIRLWRQNDLCKVVNKHTHDFDVNIQRGTIWGNPYTREEHGDKAIPLYREYLKNLISTGELTKDHLEVLRGMRLGCTCYPNPCHGDVLASLVNRLFKDQIDINNLVT